MIKGDFDIASATKSLARELAEAAGISEGDAMSVLKVLHIEKLEENVSAHREIMSNPAMVNVLNIPKAQVSELQALGTNDAMSVKNLRLAIKPQAMSGIMV